MIQLKTLTPHPPPLRQEEDGTLRVGNSRVTMDTIIGAFNDGTSLETIADRYPSLSLTDIYAVVTYYLWNREAVDSYVAEQQARRIEIRTLIESRLPKQGFRVKLLARRAAAPQKEKP